MDKQLRLHIVINCTDPLRLDLILDNILTVLQKEEKEDGNMEYEAVGAVIEREDDG